MPRQTMQDVIQLSVPSAWTVTAADENDATCSWQAGALPPLDADLSAKLGSDEFGRNCRLGLCDAVGEVEGEADGREGLRLWEAFSELPGVLWKTKDTCVLQRLGSMEGFRLDADIGLGGCTRQKRPIMAFAWHL